MCRNGVVNSLIRTYLHTYVMKQNNIQLDNILIYIFPLQQSPDSTMLSQPTPPKNQRLVPNPANNNAGSKISLNHYLKRLHSKNTDEYDEVFERNKVDVPLPLPAPDELFQGTESNSISQFFVYFFLKND